MKIAVTYTGIDDARLALATFSERRLSAAVATALTRTARDLGTQWTDQLAARIDRPTPATRRAVLVRRAEASSLQAVVMIKDTSSTGLAPAEYLRPQEQGGRRGIKKFERALQSQGSMPAGHRVVPGKHAKLDAYGNISRGQIVQVINQLGAQYSPGYQRVIGATAAKRMAAAKRSGREYVAIPTQVGKIKPGVYLRSGRELLPVFWYVSSVSYRRRLDLVASAERAAPVILTRHLDRAIAEQIARVGARR